MIVRLKTLDGCSRLLEMPSCRPPQRLYLAMMEPLRIPMNRCNEQDVLSTSPVRQRTYEFWGHIGPDMVEYHEVLSRDSY